MDCFQGEVLLIPNVIAPTLVMLEALRSWFPRRNGRDFSSARPDITHHHTLVHTIYLQLGVLIEAMRREGFELSISRPSVLFKTDEKSGEKLEPMEEIYFRIDHH